VTSVIHDTIQNPENNMYTAFITLPTKKLRSRPNISGKQLIYINTTTSIHNK
jgi:hypothetical protein